MYADILPDQIEPAVEALLLVSSEPVSILTLAQMIECDSTEIVLALESLAKKYADENRGIQLREVAGGWRLCTHPAFHELIEKYVVSWDTRRLTQAAMECLAIIAYTQPCTRADVSTIRGVNSDSSINSLFDKGLIREAGVADAPGNPVLYATSKTFLERYGLRSTADLPELELYAPDEATADLIRERLSATRVTQDSLFDDDLEPVDIDPDNMTLASEGEDDQTSPFESMNAVMRSALAGFAGAVEKVDFDSLVFESDDDE